MARFEVNFSIRKEFREINFTVNGEISFALINLALISLFHVHTKEPANRSTTTREFLFLSKFIIIKIFETISP